MMTDTVVRIGIVDNDPLVANALAPMFSGERVPVRVMWSVDTAAKAQRLCLKESQRPDVVLTDLNMPVMGGMGLARWISVHVAGIGVVGMTAFHSPIDEFQMEHSGMSDVLYKDANLANMVQAIGKAAGIESVARWGTNGESVDTRAVDLTETEIRVLRLFLGGYTVRQVSEELNMGEGTVKTHANKAYKKLGCITDRRPLWCACRKEFYEHSPKAAFFGPCGV